MKTGILVYNSYNGIFNIGDYVQSLAARQFYPDNKADVFVNRERLDEQTEPVCMIMNGWYMHEPKHWPPSKSIRPLYVAFHINSVARDALLSDESIEYLKEYEPIGCRDILTANLLKDKGVDAYFSGCLTLTLCNKYKCAKRTDNIYIVDPHFVTSKKFTNVIQCAFTAFFRYGIISGIAKKMYGNKSLKYLIKTSSFYNCYSKVFDKEVLCNATYVAHLCKDVDFNDEEAKFEYAAELLQLYANAKFVVTSRIHCALPCVGMDTPVIYVDDKDKSETSYCRLNGLIDLFENVLVYDNGKLYRSTDNKISSQTTLGRNSKYVKLKEDLTRRCTEFIRKNILQ